MPCTELGNETVFCCICQSKVKKLLCNFFISFIGENHSIRIYYPSAAGGGMKELFRKVSLSFLLVIVFLKYATNYNIFAVLVYI